METSILQKLAEIAAEEHDLVSAIRYMELSLGIRGKNNFDFSNDIIYLFNDYRFPTSSKHSILSQYYAKAGNWEKALIIEKNQASYWQRRYKESPIAIDSYISALDSYASLLTNAGRYKDAFRIYCQIVELAPLSEWHQQDLGDSYYDLGDFENAIRTYRKLVVAPLDSSSYLNRLAICYSALRDVERAIQVQRKCIAKINPQLLSYKNHYNGYAGYTTFLSNLANFFNQDEQYDSALVYERKSLELKTKYFPSDSVDIAYSYMNMGYALGEKGLWKEAIEHLLYSYEIYKKQKHGKFYQRVLSYLSEFSSILGEYDNLNGYILEYLESARDDLVSTFQELTYDERSKYVEGYAPMLTLQIPNYAYYTKTVPIISSSFDASLLMKGALLSSESEVKRVINESKDVSLVDSWEELRTNRYILSKQIEKDSLKRLLNVDSLQRVIYQLEDSLIVKCKEYGDIARSMELEWKDIQDRLNSNDIAVEFLSFPIKNDSIMYIALTLRKDSETPKMTILFEEKQLKEVPDTLYYQCQEMTDLAWKPLSSELQGVKKHLFLAIWCPI